MEQKSKKIPVAIIGANGYTGIELVRILLEHPHAELTTITSRQYEGKKLADIFPNFQGHSDLSFEAMQIKNIAKKNQAIFLCLPHHQSMEIAAKFRKHAVKVIDLSADFRFSQTRVYEKVYGKHTQKQLNRSSSYGLCEIFSEEIKQSHLIGVPGCYVTSILLALAPLLQNQLIIPNNIICDSKSGSSGAGRSAKVDQLLAESYGNFKAYGIGNHRHRPEIEEKLSLLASDKVKISFTPHLLPISRGILSTCYAQPIRKWNNKKLTDVFRKFYQRSPFVKVVDSEHPPHIKQVVGTNECHLSVHYDDHSEKIIIVSVLDNLLKGASGQAVQCFNLMYGLNETNGLSKIALHP
jgi:N-acetyl-gamma-glutamyl-phosphate reductase